MRNRAYLTILAGLLPLAGLAQGTIIVTGTDAGFAPHVKVFDGQTGAERMSFFAYGAGFTGGVRVAAGDVNGDGTPDIVTGAGTLGQGHVKVFDGVGGAEIASFLAFPGFSGGVNVAVGDVDGDGLGDLVVGADALVTHVKVFKGSDLSLHSSFFAYPGVVSGVRLGSGDYDNDGHSDIVTGLDPGLAAHVKVLDGTGAGTFASFFAYPAYSGGVNVAMGDVNNDDRADIVTGTETLTTHVKVFEAGTLSELRSFFAYGSFTGGVRVASADLDGDGFSDVITGTGPGAAHLKVFDGVTNGERLSFLPYGSGYSGGIYVAGAVPEPASLAILGLGALVLVRRRRRAP